MGLFFKDKVKVHKDWLGRKVSKRTDFWGNTETTTDGVLLGSSVQKVTKTNKDGEVIERSTKILGI